LTLIFPAQHKYKLLINRLCLHTPCQRIFQQRAAKEKGKLLLASQLKKEHQRTFQQRSGKALHIDFLR